MVTSRTETFPEGNLTKLLPKKGHVLAALDSNQQNPYETVRQRGDHSYAVGRDGSTWNQMSHYLMTALTPEILALLGDPPDYSKLGEILKEHPEMLGKLQENMQKLVKEGKIPG